MVEGSHAGRAGVKEGQEEKGKFNHQGRVCQNIRHTLEPHSPDTKNRHCFFNSAGFSMRMDSLYVEKIISMFNNTLIRPASQSRGLYAPPNAWEAISQR